MKIRIAFTSIILALITGCASAKTVHVPKHYLCSFGHAEMRGHFCDVSTSYPDNSFILKHYYNLDNDDACWDLCDALNGQFDPTKNHRNESDTEISPRLKR